MRRLPIRSIPSGNPGLTLSLTRKLRSVNSMPTRSYADLSTRPNVAQIRRELAEFGYAPDDINDLIRYTSEDPSRPNKEWKVPNAAGFITLRYLGHSRFTLED